MCCWTGVCQVFDVEVRAVSVSRLEVKVEGETM